MHKTLLLTALWFTQLPTLGGTTQIRNTFLVATETVIDNATAVDLRASDDRYEAQLKQLRQSKDTLTQMAEGQRENDVADDVNNLVFLISACRIQAKTGADTAKCTAQLATAETRIMDAIGAHKSNGAWKQDAAAR